MAHSLAQITLVVREYDEAIEYFTKRLGFALLEDTRMSDDKRWVVVAPDQGRGCSLLLARATTPEQEACIGKQAGGRVGFFLHTDDCMRDHELLTSRGVRFEESPRCEPYGTVAVFVDLYGNRWDLLQLAAAE